MHDSVFCILWDDFTRTDFGIRRVRRQMGLSTQTSVEVEYVGSKAKGGRAAPMRPRSPRSTLHSAADSTITDQAGHHCVHKSREKHTLGAAVVSPLCAGPTRLDPAVDGRPRGKVGIKMTPYQLKIPDWCDIGHRSNTLFYSPTAQCRGYITRRLESAFCPSHQY